MNFIKIATVFVFIQGGFVFGGAVHVNKEFDEFAFKFVTESCAPLSGSTSYEDSVISKIYLSASEQIFAAGTFLSLDKVQEIQNSGGIGAMLYLLLQSEGYYKGLRQCWPNENSARDNFTIKLFIADILGRVMGINQSALVFYFTGLGLTKAAGSISGILSPLTIEKIFRSLPTEKARKLFSGLLLSSPFVYAAGDLLREYMKNKNIKMLAVENEVQKTCNEIQEIQELRGQILQDQNLSNQKRDELLKELDQIYKVDPKHQKLLCNRS